MHRPDAAAHGDGRSPEPAQAGGARSSPHAGGEIERRIGGERGDQDRQRHQNEVVGAWMVVHSAESSRCSPPKYRLQRGVGMAIRSASDGDPSRLRSLRLRDAKKDTPGGQPAPPRAHAPGFAPHAASFQVATGHEPHAVPRHAPLQQRIASIAGAGNRMMEPAADACRPRPLSSVHTSYPSPRRKEKRAQSEKLTCYNIWHNVLT